ncbi:hypothetical protein [Dyella sp. C9]|uniref:hypothetical protein n=1 Tax=Dyella sp. C9 TaxID=2202154 RepID=UPI000DEFB689|nr:hypothetical protein [Dyella sp. C9]
MRINEGQMDRQALARFGEEAIALLKAGDFVALAARFGYALAYGREPAKAMESDLIACLSEDEGSPGPMNPSIAIKYYDAQAVESIGVSAAIECTTRLAHNSAILLALVVTGSGEEHHVSLEGFSRV